MNIIFAKAGSELVGWRGLRRRVEAIALAAAPREVIALNAGSGTSDVFERVVSPTHPNIRFDRVDIVDATVTHPAVRNTWRASVENMPMVADEAYDVVFAIWVLEHVQDLEAGLSEFCRVLRPGGYFIATIPNPVAPEFLVARFTPTRIHSLFKAAGFETHYAFRSVGALVDLSRRSGLETVEVVYSPALTSYVERVVPRLAPLSHGYDGAVLRLRIRALCGSCVVSMRKV